jgi:hypothetical protein
LIPRYKKHARSETEESPMPDHSTLIAEFLAEHWEEDRDALACDLISQWPHLTGAEIEQAIEVAGQRRERERLSWGAKLSPRISQGLGADAIGLNGGADS